MLGQGGRPWPSATLCPAANNGNLVPYGAEDVKGEIVEDPECPRANDDEAKEQLQSVSFHVFG